MIVRLQHSTHIPGRATRIANELEDLWDKVNWDDNARVVVLAYDRKAFKPDTGEASPWGKYDPASLVTPVARLKQPLIDVAEADALGVGLELALAHGTGPLAVAFHHPGPHGRH